MTVAIGIPAARMAGIAPPSTPAARPACHGKETLRRKGS